jgi:hypothetical protein
VATLSLRGDYAQSSGWIIGTCDRCQGENKNLVTYCYENITSVPVYNNVFLLSASKVRSETNLSLYYKRKSMCAASTSCNNSVHCLMTQSSLRSIRTTYRGSIDIRIFERARVSSVFLVCELKKVWKMLVLHTYPPWPVLQFTIMRKDT